MPQLTEKLYREDQVFRAQKNIDMETRRNLVEALSSPDILGQDECCLILSFGIGDYMMALGLSGAFEGQHGLKIGAYAGRTDLEFLLSLYPVSQNYVEFTASSIDWRWANEIARGAAYYAHFPLFELPKMIGYKGMELLDAHRCRLGLPETAELRLPYSPSPEEITAAEAELSRLGLTPGKTVFIATKARSVKWRYFPDNFWRDLREKFLLEGFRVKFTDNDALNKEINEPPIEIQLDKFRGLVKAAGHFVNVRSGLTELALNTGITQTSLYPATGNKIAKFNLSQYNCPNSHLEIEFDRDSADIERITNSIVESHLKTDRRRKGLSHKLTELISSFR